MMAIFAASNLSEGATPGPYQLMCWAAHLLGFWEAAVRFSVRRRSRRIGSQAHTGFLAVTGTVAREASDSGAEHTQFFGMR